MEAPDPPDPTDKSKGKRPMGAAESSSDPEDYQPDSKKARYRISSARKPKPPGSPVTAPGKINLAVRSKTEKTRTVKDKDGGKETWDIEGKPKKDETDDDTLLRLAQEDPEELIKSYPNDLHKDILWIIASKPGYSPLGKFIEKLREHHPDSVFRKVRGPTADDVFRNRFSKAMTRVQEQFGPLHGYSSEVFPPHSGYHDALTWRHDGRPRFFGLKQNEKDALKAAKKKELEVALEAAKKKGLENILKEGEAKSRRVSKETSSSTARPATQPGAPARASRRHRTGNAPDPHSLGRSSGPSALSSEGAEFTPDEGPRFTSAQAPALTPSQAAASRSIPEEAAQLSGFSTENAQHYSMEQLVHPRTQFPARLRHPQIRVRRRPQAPAPPVTPTAAPHATLTLPPRATLTLAPRATPAVLPLSNAAQPMPTSPQPAQPPENAQSNANITPEQREAYRAAVADYLEKWSKEHPYDDQKNDADYYPGG